MLIAALAVMIGMAGAPAHKAVPHKAVAAKPAAVKVKGLYLSDYSPSSTDSMFINLATVERTAPGTFRVWTVIVNRYDDVQLDVKYMQYWREVKCPARTVRNLRSIAYSTGGAVLLDITEREAPEGIVPESRGESIHHLVCTPGALKAINTDQILPNIATAIAFYDRVSKGAAEARADLDRAGEGAAPREAATNGSASADEFTRLAFEDMEAGRDDSARANFDRAVALGARMPETYMGRAIIRLRAGEMENARADYDHALALDPENGAAYAGRAQLLSEMDEPEAAIHDASRALELMPGKAYLYAMRGWAFEATKQWDLAFADFNAAVKLDPEDANAWAGRGAADFGRDNYEAALQSYGRALALAPDIGWIYTRRGATYLTMSNYDAALADFSKALALAPDDKEAVLLRDAAQQAKSWETTDKATKTIS